MGSICEMGFRERMSLRMKRAWELEGEKTKAGEVVTDFGVLISQAAKELREQVAACKNSHRFIGKR